MALSSLSRRRWLSAKIYSYSDEVSTSKSWPWKPSFGRLTHKIIWHVQLSTSCKGFHFSRCIRLTWGQQRDVDYEGTEQESLYSQLFTKTIRYKSHDSSHESCQTLSHRQCRSSKALRERERQPTVNWIEENVVTAMDKERNSY